MTLANKVTIARILLIPVFVVQVIYYWQTGLEWHRWAALVLFALAALSDGIDGWIARRFNQRSRLGTFLDPLADKMLLVAALILLSRSGSEHLPVLPLWLVATVLSRDGLLMIGLLVVYFTCGQIAVKPHFIGKAATVLQMGVVVLALVNEWPSLRWWIALGAAVTTAISGLIYLQQGIQQLNASPDSAPEASRTPRTGT
jgi:CDP-diacylglycerol--glycerol-3-phosphate 3-phosphatidyltransferase